MGYIIRQPVITEKPARPEERSKAEPTRREEVVISAEPAPAAQPAPEQIEAVFAEAREKGKKAGEKAGYTAGYEKGYQEGSAQGEKAAMAEWEPRQAQMDTLLASLSDARKEAITRIDDEFIPVVFSALTKIVGEMAFSEDFIRAAVRQALQMVRNQEQITIRLNPADLAFVQKDPALQKGQIALQADNSIHSGCVIETSCGNIDAQLDVQLASLRKLLTRVRSQMAEGLPTVEAEPDSEGYRA